MVGEAFERNLSLIRESIYRGNVSEGIVKLTTVLEETEDPEERVEVTLDIVMLSLACGDMEEATSRWKEVRRYHLQSVRVSAYGALFAILDGNRDEGFARFQDCILDKPECFEFYFLRGLAYSQCEQYEHALADLERANTLSANNVLLMSLMADINAELGHEDRAISLHESVLGMCPDYRRSLMSLGVLYFDKQQFESAFRLFQCLVGYDPLNWFAWACLGDIRLMQRGRSFQAMPYYATSVVAGAQLSQPYLNLARGLYCLGKYREGLRVLEKFEASYHLYEWPKEDYVTYQFLKLIGDCVTDGGRLRNTLSSRVRSIKSRVDNEIMYLLEVLCVVSAYRIEGNMYDIFYSHIHIFVQLAEYMRRCNGRVVEIDETILLGSIARLFIWNGFLFEARAILGLLSKSDDVLSMDMVAMLWKSFYDYAEVVSQSDVHPEGYHRRIIESPEVEQFVDALTHHHTDSVPVTPEWRKILSDCIKPEHEDTAASLLFGLKDESGFDQLNRYCDEDPGHARQIGAFWQVYMQYCSGQNRSAGSDAFDRLPELKKVLSHFEHGFDAACSGHDKLSPDTTDDRYGRILSSVLSDRQIAMDLTASNEDMVQVCANDPDVALGGYDPLPFALDGLSLKKYLQSGRNRTEVEASGYLVFICQWLKRYYIANLREAQHLDISSHLAEETLSRLGHKLLDFSLGVHGQNAIGNGLFVLEDGSPDTDFIDILKCIQKDHPVIRHLLYLGEHRLYPDGGIRLQFNPIERSYYTIMSVPEVSGISSVLSVPSMDLPITKYDLYELFYNRAVYAVKCWIESRRPDDLQIFFDRKRPFVFRALNIPVIRSKQLKKKTRLLSRHSLSHMSIHASNSDREQNLSVRIVDKGRKRYRHREDRQPQDVIRHASELSEALEYVNHYVESHGILAMTFEVSPGVRNHPFLQQFKEWARYQADILWPEIALLGNVVDRIREVGPYEACWRVTELLRRYPWMSPLYCILAGVYVAQGEEEKALQAIYTGLSWDERLYEETGWLPVHAEDPKMDTAIDPVEAMTELEETRSLLWPERYIFLNNDENMYHYGDIFSGYHLRVRRPVGYSVFMDRMANSDKRGCYDFYRLFRKFIVQDGVLRSAYLDAVREPGVYSLKDYMVHVIRSMEEPESFPLRRQLAEMLFQLYPDMSTGALGRFYCDNLQPSNALLYSSYAYLSETSDDKSDDASQSAVTLGCLFYDMGFMDEAMRYLKRATKMKNPSPMAFLTLGCVLIEMRKFRQAIQYLNAGLKLDPTSDRFYYNMALAYIELGELDEAEKAIKSGIDLSRYPVDLKMQLARIYVKRQQFVEALPLMKYVSEEDPDLFMTAIQFIDFEAFAKLKPVQEIIDSCMAGRRS